MHLQLNDNFFVDVLVINGHRGGIMFRLVNISAMIALTTFTEGICIYYFSPCSLI
jgi:hypothetical protein